MSDEQTPAAPAKPARKPKPPSRSQRWADAVKEAQDAIEALQTGVQELQSALEDLRGVQEEYEEWKDNLPENLASSALGEKLEEVCALEIEGIGSAVEDAINDAENVIGDAEAVELPQGFGRD